MASPSTPPAPPALIASIAFGSVGLALLVVGLVTGSQILQVSGVAAGAISLVAALVWREQLIEAWHARKRQPED